MTVADISPSNILVNVDFYDEEQKAKLLQYPQTVAAAMQKLVKEPVSIPLSQFLTFFLFHRLGRGLPGYESAEAIRDNLLLASHYIDRCLAFDKGSIRLPSQEVQLPNDLLEHMGEAVGLSIASRIHEVTEADWRRVAVQKHDIYRKLVRSFDFQQAADGNAFVQLETKGCATENNQKKSSNISAHKASILGKKASLQSLPFGSVDPYPAAVRYGTIAAVDGREDSVVKCWLVDPEPEEVQMQPRRFKLLTRMAFISKWISVVSPRSALATALATRLNALESLKDPFELDKAPLMRAGGEPFFFPMSGWRGVHSTFFNNKSRIQDGPAGGIGMQIHRNMLALVGIRQDLVDLAVEQDFGAILDYTAPAGTLNKTVVFSFPKNTFARMTLPAAIRQSAWHLGEYSLFRLSGNTHYNHSGLAFGFYALGE